VSYPQIVIENRAEGKQIAQARNTRVFVLREDAEGNEERIDISNLVRACDARLHVGEVVTAKLEVFITGIETRAEVESLLLTTFKPRRRSLWRRWRQITTLGSATQEYVR
jgi:hypothetical protein